MKSHAEFLLFFFFLLALMRQTQIVTPRNWYLSTPTDSQHADVLSIRKVAAHPDVMFMLNCVFEYDCVIEYGLCGAPS